MRKLLYLYSLISLGLCYSQNIDSQDYNLFSKCSDNVSIQYWKPTKKAKNKRIANKSDQKVTVFLESYFNGIVRGYVAKEKVFSENVVTEESLGTTGKYFIYDYSKDSDLPTIKILTENDCLEINIKKKYKLVYIYNYKERWDVIYSNFYPTYE